MLKLEAIPQPLLGSIMSDTALIKAIIKTTLLEISKQQKGLGIALQNAAPVEKAGEPNKSVQYLLEGSEQLLLLVEECEKLSSQS